MKKTFILFFLLLQFSCAYFNTFYNAKNYYKKGRKASENNVSTKLSNNEIKNYDLTVEKCESVIRKFPNSRYVDDALLLMSKAQFYLGDFDKSKLNLEELIRRFPGSNLKDEALLWSGRAAWKLGQFTMAEEGIIRVLSTTEDRKLLSSGYEMLAEIYRDKKDDENEVKYLREVIKYSKDNQQKAETHYRIGLIILSQKDYSNAIASFQKVEAQLPSPELLEKSKMQNTRALKHMGNTTEALNILQGMLDSKVFKKIWGEIELEIADISLITGDIEGAIDHYGTIALIYTKSKTAVKAWYKLAELHTYSIDGNTGYINYPYGKVYYQRAENGSKKGFYHIASRRNKLILDAFFNSSNNVTKDKIELIWLAGDKELANEKWHDFTLKQTELLDGILPAKILIKAKKTKNQPLEDDDERSEKELLEENSELAAQLFAEQFGDDNKNPNSNEQKKVNKDSLALRLFEKEELGPAKLDSIELLEKNAAVKKKSSNPFGKRPKDTILRELVHNEYLMAEFYQLDLIQPDSAIIIYKNILSDYPDSEFAPRSALSLGIIYSEMNKELADSMFNLVLTLYPRSPSTIEVNRRMNNSFSKSKISINPVSELYQEAYNKAFIDKNNQGTLKIVDLIERNYPNSFFAAKAAYLRAYMIDNSNKSPEISLEEYDRVIKNYSDSDFAKEARIRVARLKRIIVKPKEPNNEIDESTDKSAKKSNQIIER